MIDEKRGKNIAIMGLCVQVLITLVTLALWRWTQSSVALAIVLLLAGGVPLWIVVSLLFYCKQLANREQMEFAQLTKDADGLFDESAGTELAVAKARVKLMERWIAPVFAIAWAGWFIFVAVILFRNNLVLPSPAAAYIDNSQSLAGGALLACICAFVAFLPSRICLALGEETQLRMLRATGGFLYICSLSLAMLSLVLALEYFEINVGFLAIIVIMFGMSLLSVEVIFNIILDFYRPRLPGRESRFSFDSRLVNIVAQPGQLGRSVADAINYQFGFEVSSSGLYQLVSRAFAPLLIFATVVLLGMSSIIIVPEDQHAVVTIWGKMDRTKAPLSPGLHLKWFWPVGSASYFETGKIHEIVLGNDARPTEFADGKSVLLWTEEHHSGPDSILALPARSGNFDQETPRVGLAKLVAKMHYKIDLEKDKDGNSRIYQYGYEFTNPHQLIEDIARAEMTKFAASTTLIERLEDIGKIDSRNPKSIMTFGRQYIAAELKERIEQRLGELDDGRGIGVKIMFLGFSAVHPPAEVAQAFEEVVSAHLAQEHQKSKARAEANKTIATVAGDLVTGLLLAQAIEFYTELEDLGRYLEISDKPASFAKAIRQVIYHSTEEVKLLERQADRASPTKAGGVNGLAGYDKAVLAMIESQKKHLALLVRLDSANTARKEQLINARHLARARMDQLFEASAGEPAKLIAQAKAQRMLLEIEGRIRSETFLSKLAAYRANPEMYKLDNYLQILEKHLPSIVKYVLAVDGDRVEFRQDRSDIMDPMGAIFKYEKKKDK